MRQHDRCNVVAGRRLSSFHFGKSLAKFARLGHAQSLPSPVGVTNDPTSVFAISRPSCGRLMCLL